MLTDGAADLSASPGAALTASEAAEIVLRDRGLKSLIERVPALTDLTISSLYASEPAYRSNIPLGQLQTQLNKSIGQILEIARTHPAERQAAMGWALEVGRYRARQGVPLDAMHRGYHIGGQVLFSSFLQWASEEDLPRDCFMALADDVWHVVDLHSATATTAFRATEIELSLDRSAEYGRLLDALLNGDADREAVAAAARAWSLSEHGRYAVLVQRLSDWDTRPLREADLPAKVAGVRVIWRIHAGCAIGVAVLGETSVIKIATALPTVPGRRTGVSLVVDGLAELARARRLAELAVRTITTRDGVSCLEERFPAALLTARPDLARELCGRTLGPVLALDKVSRDLLLDALDAWLAADGSASQAAAALYCHRNTVLNRMRRLERLTGRSLSAPKDLVELSLALQAYNLGTASSRR
jgi:hypothetical protein